MSRVFTSAEKHKITEIINQGVQVTIEINTLKEGLNDTVKNLAEELEIKPAVLKRAIRTAFKANLDKNREEFAELETILETAGRA
jgi:hypothetical protein